MHRVAGRDRGHERAVAAYDHGVGWNQAARLRLREAETDLPEHARSSSPDSFGGWTSVRSVRETGSSARQPGRPCLANPAGNSLTSTSAARPGWIERTLVWGMFT